MSAANPEPPVMKVVEAIQGTYRYKVAITRTTTTSREFEVKAHNVAEAERLARDEAYGFVWDEDNAEYEIDGVECPEDPEPEEETSQ